MEHVLATILAGGTSRELPVLTAHRSKAALPFGGRYRVIDFCLSNCMHSEISNVGILAEYNPASLLMHLGDGSPWDLCRKKGGLNILQPYTARGESNWFRGTADALSQYLEFIKQVPCEYVIVLSGDQVYKMDYREPISHHVNSGTSVTIAVKRCNGNLPPHVGAIEIDQSGKVTNLVEKPENRDFDFFSLGIYVFSRNALVDAIARLREDQYDLVFDIIMPLIRSGNVCAYNFGAFWADVGHLEQYFGTSMGLLGTPPSLDLAHPDWKICTKPIARRPAIFGREAKVERCLVSSGCTVLGTVRQSILFPGVVVSKDSTVENSIIFDDVVIEEGAVVRSAIIDKRAVVGKASFIGYGNPTCPNSHYADVLRSGITVIGTQTHVPADMKIGRNCVIGSDLGAESFPGRDIVCGETLIGEAKWQKISS